MVEPRTLSVFLPSLTLQKESCILLGTKDTSRALLHVTHCVSLQNASNNGLKGLIRDHAATGSGEGISVLGVYISKTHEYDAKCLEQCLKWMNSFPEWVVFRETLGELPCCTLHGNWRQTDPPLKTVLVLFDADELHTSCLLDIQSEDTNAGNLHKSWQKAIRFVERNNLDVEGFVCEESGVITMISNAMYGSFAKITFYLTTLLVYIYDSKLIKYSSSSSYLPKPAVLQQLEKNIRQLHNVSMNHAHSRLDTLRFTNAICNQILDIILGLVVMMYLGEFSACLTNELVYWAELVAAELQLLLKWMMGVPAGLKLNKELAYCLGQFFIYHIHLWKGYLHFLVPLWSDAVRYVSLSGCLGLSIQLSLIQDVFSMMTLHCYCFYVYAARLYSLQVYALQSLWRLFRGKKWNPLFERVDSSTYDVDQLFIGTILFTILLFLLPTTGLFYIVFTILRLLVLTMQGTLYYIVGFLQSFHIYAIYLRLVIPNKIAADLQLCILPRSGHQPLYHSIQLMPVSWTRLFQVINPPSPGVQKATESWGSFIHKILVGNLIYPWIQSNE